MLKKNAIIEIENALGYEFKNKQLLNNCQTNYKCPKYNRISFMILHMSAPSYLSLHSILLYTSKQKKP